MHRSIFDLLKKEWSKAKGNSYILKRIASRLTVHASILSEFLFAAGIMLEWAKESWKGSSEEETLKQILEVEQLLVSVIPHDEKERNECNE